MYREGQINKTKININSLFHIKRVNRVVFTKTAASDAVKTENSSDAGTDGCKK